MAKAWEIERRSCVGDVPYYRMSPVRAVSPTPNPPCGLLFIYLFPTPAHLPRNVNVDASTNGPPPLDLTYIGTDPAHSHCGAGHLLMQWGIEQCDASRSPLYLESTVEAVPFYHKYGFIRGETIALPVRPDGGAKTEIYEEIVFTYTPA